MTRASIPLYINLEKTLRNRILAGKYKPYDSFPTESQLCQEFGVSRITVRQALMILESDNLIRREQGRGTFVTGLKGAEYQLSLPGRVDDLSELGTKTTLKLISKKLISPKTDLLQDMNLEAEAKVYLFEGIRFLYAEYNAFVQIYLPEDIGRIIPLEDFDGALLIERVEQESREKVKRVQQYISASITDKRIAQLIRVKIGHPLLIIKRIYFSETGRCLETGITSLPGDAYHNMADLVRNPSLVGGS